MKKLLILLLVLLLMSAGCMNNKPIESEKDLTSNQTGSETSEITEINTESAEIIEKTMYETESENQQKPDSEYVKILSNEGGMQINKVIIPLSGEFSTYQSHKFDNRYKIFITYEYDHQLNIDMNRFYNISIYVVDILEGKVIFSEKIEDEIEHNTIFWNFHNSENECSIFSMSVENGEYVLHCGYLLKKTDDGFTLTSSDCTPFPQSESPMYSPDGTTAVYFTLEDGYGAGGIDVRYPNGEVRRILSNRILDYSSNAEFSLGDFRGYSPYGFIDNTHFVYSITGYEWFVGYGICDITTGETVEYSENYRPLGTYDGAAYFILFDGGENTYEPSTADFWKMTSDGEMTKIASTEETENTVRISSDLYMTFDNGVWTAFHSGSVNGISFGGTGDMIKVSFYSADLSKLLAQIEMPNTGGILENCNVYENSLTAVLIEKTK